MEDCQLIQIAEFEIDAETKASISQLLQECFPDYPQRIYYSQLHNFRMLTKKGNRLIGHMAIDVRMIKVGAETARIFGIGDICVAEEFQAQHVASNMLKKVELLGKKHGIDFLVLISNQHEVYLKNGFDLVENTCRWLMINEHQTLGVGHRRLEDCVMTKPLGKLQWNKGLVDFLGPIF